MLNPLNNQRGVVLIAGLLILVILSLMGITTLQTSTIEEKMTSNMGQRQLAFQAAEAGLREAEVRLSGLGGIDSTLPILPPASPGVTPVWDTTSRWTGANSQIASDLNASIYAEQPRYIVEELQIMPVDDEVLDADNPVETETMYRVTSRGVGGSGTAEVLLQITHLR